MVNATPDCSLMVDSVLCENPLMFDKILEYFLMVDNDL